MGSSSVSAFGGWNSGGAQTMHVSHYGYSAPTVYAPTSAYVPVQNYGYATNNSYYDGYNTYAPSYYGNSYNPGYGTGFGTGMSVGMGWGAGGYMPIGYGGGYNSGYGYDNYGGGCSGYCYGSPIFY